MITGVIGTIVYLFLVFFDVISRCIPKLNYFDELIVFALLALAILKWFIKPHHKTKYFYLSLVAITLILFIGIASNYASSTYLGVIPLIKDIVLTFKYVIAMFSSLYLFKGKYNYALKKNLIAVTKILIVVIFLFYPISMVFDLGMTGSVRMGIPSYKFLYSHYTYLVFNCVVFLSVLSLDYKKNYLYYVLCLFLMIMTLRTKSLAFVAVFVIYKFFESKKIEFKKWYLIPVSLVGIGVMVPKLIQYIEWGYDYNLRNGLYVIGLLAMFETFPLGTGFASFGTNLSYIYGSRIYTYYDMIGHYQGMEVANHYSFPISDVYWPSIYAQFGVIGFFSFSLLLFIVLKKIMKIKATKQRCSILIMFAYLFISSIAEASYTNDTAIFTVIFTILILMTISKKEREYD